MFKKGWKGGPGRPKRSENVVTKKVRSIAQRLVSNPTYRKQLLADLETRSLEATLEAMLWYYAYGKPKESMQVDYDLKNLSVAELKAMETMLKKVS